MKKLLIIEPDAVTASQYKKSFHNFEISLCTNGQLAIVAADKQTPDIVLLELALARNSGIEFIYEFRSYGEWQYIPIVVLSRLSQSQSGLDEKTMKSLGVYKYLYKPDTTPDILNSVVGGVQAPVRKSQ